MYNGSALNIGNWKRVALVWCRIIWGFIALHCDRIHCIALRSHSQWLESWKTGWSAKTAGGGYFNAPHDRALKISGPSWLWLSPKATIQSNNKSLPILMNLASIGQQVPLFPNRNPLAFNSTDIVIDTWMMRSWNRSGISPVLIENELIRDAINNWTVLFCFFVTFFRISNLVCSDLHHQLTLTVYRFQTLEEHFSFLTRGRKHFYHDCQFRYINLKLGHISKKIYKMLT